ncbi:MAG: zinc ABC transporter substrate-binding protein [Myxococcota bacterium]|nr:zinc ABC transporter substrate-binding protein [Myxococcota bacterium]
MVALILSAIFGLPMGCGKTREAPPKPVVAVSIVPQAYFVRRIAGDSVRVEVMIPPGANPATYEPTVDQMTALSKAALYVKVGHESFPFEQAWLDKLLAQAPSATVIDSTKGISLISGDPHVWVSPRQARKMAQTIAAGLKAIVPSKADAFDRNLNALQSDMDAMDAGFKALFSDLSLRRFYVFHAAWTYFAKDYGLEQVSLEHGHREPSSHAIQEVVVSAKEAGVKTIFAQPQMSAKSAELVAQEIGGRVVIIDPLAADWMVELRRAAKEIQKALTP